MINPFSGAGGQNILYEDLSCRSQELNSDKSIFETVFTKSNNLTIVNFIHVDRTNVRFGSFYYVHVTRKKAAKMTFVRKTRAFYVDDIDTWSRILFHPSMR